MRSVWMPEWMRRAIPTGGAKSSVESTLKTSNLFTVCEEAKCPNRAECFCNGTATFLIMGDICSRHCAFCSVKSGELAPLDADEPRRLAEAVAEMDLAFVVLTSVTRDDLADGGAAHIALCVETIKEMNPAVDIEVLIPDFNGDESALNIVLESGIAVLNHNVEMPSFLYRKFRPEAGYKQSLELLSRAKLWGSVPVKSGFMVGLGESDEDIFALLDDLMETGVNIVTIGQYLRPSKKQAPVKRYVEPEQFEEYKKYGESIGINHIEAGPFVRSSYNAATIINKNISLG